MSIETISYSEVGGRKENEDSVGILACANDIFAGCVADGVGGSNCGKLASRTAVNYFLNKVKSFEDDLSYSMIETHKLLQSLQQKENNCKDMATTFTGILVNDNFLKGVHLGDTRCHILRGNGIKQLTQDHTEYNRLINEESFIKQNSKFIYNRNVLESALGIKNRSILIQEFKFDLKKKDRILITSDGVHDLVSKIMLRDISKSSHNVTEFKNNVLDKLKTMELTDNVSFVLFEVN